MKRFLLFVFALVLSLPIFSQSYAFGVKGGLTVGVQQWNTFERDPLLKYHGVAFIETANEGENFALFAEAGLHLKGSAIRNRNFVNPINGTIVRPPAFEFIFRNISLVLGGKQKFDLGVSNAWYWLFGIRGDYTISTNLGEFSDLNAATATIFPIDDDLFINQWNYGVTVGAGIEFPLSEYIGAVLEFSVSPDFSLQYNQPEIPNVFDPFTGNNRTLGERKIRNLVFEITAGFRFLHRIEYLDN